MEGRFVFCIRRQINPAGTVPATNDQETAMFVRLCEDGQCWWAKEGAPVEEQVGAQGSFSCWYAYSTEHELLALSPAWPGLTITTWALQ